MRKLLIKKDIEELETQIAIECIKAYHCLLKIEMFEADSTVKELKNGQKVFIDIQKNG